MHIKNNILYTYLAAEQLSCIIIHHDHTSKNIYNVKKMQAALIKMNEHYLFKKGNL